MTLADLIPDTGPLPVIRINPCGEPGAYGLTADDWAVDGPRNSEAAAACQECLVRGRCLDWAMDNAEHEGVWGGKTSRQRKSMRRWGIRPSHGE